MEYIQYIPFLSFLAHFPNFLGKKDFLENPAGQENAWTDEGRTDPIS